MTDNELLLAITGIIDKRTAKLEDKMDCFQNDMNDLKQDVHILKQDVGVLKEDVRVLKEDVCILKEDVRVLKEDVDVLKQKVTKLEITNENYTWPAIREISECYTSTYRRYAEGIGQMDQIRDDVLLLKNVVQEHSLKLQTI